MSDCRGLGVLLLVLGFGCGRAREAPPAAKVPLVTVTTASSAAPSPIAGAVPDADPPDPAEIDQNEPPPPAPSPTAELIEPIKVKVPSDKPVLVVQGDTPTPIVYLHGRCGDPHAFVAWAHVGKKFGTIVSLTGDEKCKDGSRTKWTDDTSAIDRRITAALRAVEGTLGIDLDDTRRIVVGYSQGSLKAEALATKYPARYPRAVLIAGPRAPRDGSLTKSEAILIMVGDHDAREHLREGAKKLEKRGKTVRYLELPGARHGEYGPDAEERMSSGLGWLTQTPAPFRS